MSDHDGGEAEVGDLGPPEYLVYCVVDQRDEQDDRETSRTRIHKLCCLADRYLTEKFGRDVGLPKYWYQYGRTIDESSFNTDVIFGPDANHFAGRAYYPADQVSEADFEHLSEDLKDDIFIAVRKMIDRHGNKTADQLEVYQYENYSPNGFVKSYDELRRYLNRISEDGSQSTFSHFISSNQKDRIEELLDKMLLAFNEEENESIYDIYLEWDDTIRLLNDLGRSPRELYEFTETFIEGIAKTQLRLDHNSHIPTDRISEWESEREDIKADLKRRIKRKRRSALKESEEKTDINKISGSYNQAIFDELDDL